MDFSSETNTLGSVAEGITLGLYKHKIPLEITLDW
jgi:hypothetical protein